MITDKEICCQKVAREMYYFNNKSLDEHGELVAELGYVESDRSYYILNQKNPNNHYGRSIDYCPWCGKKLPEQLDPWAWIEYEYGEEYVTAYDDPKYKPLPPEIEKEFETDEWWKKRHLDDPKILAKWAKKIPNLISKPAYNPPMNP